MIIIQIYVPQSDLTLVIEPNHCYIMLNITREAFSDFFDGMDPKEREYILKLVDRESRKLIGMYQTAENRFEWVPHENAVVLKIFMKETLGSTS